jgi:hypothetical protein
VAVSAGFVHSLALKADGTVVAWGAGTTNDGSQSVNYGQAIVPAGLSNVVAVVAGVVHSVALKADGTVVVWGDNQYGETNVPAGLDNVVALSPGALAEDILVLRKRSSGPVAWLDSDNTFKGNIQINGTLQVGGDAQILGQLTAGAGVRLNDSNIWFRAGIDQNNGLGWYGPGKSFAGVTPNGPILFGLGGGALGSTSNGVNAALTWDNAQHVGIGTTTPSARLSLGGDDANTKLVLLDNGGSPGLGLGAQTGLLRFHLSGGVGDRFSFLNAPAGTEVFSVTYNGQVRFGSSAQYNVPATEETLRIIRGVVAANGAILYGTGFSVTHPTNGQYTVTFTTAFTDFPSVTATAQSGLMITATVTSVSASSVPVRTFNSAGTAVDNQFHFIAIGPR